MRIGNLHLIAVISLGALSTLGATGCVVGDAQPGSYYAPEQGPPPDQAAVTVQTGEPSYVYTSNLPPDPIYEQVGPAPSYGYVWIDGYWNWNGGQWGWIGGRWEAPRNNYVYIQPYYDYVGTSYVYTPGYWADRGHVPAGVVIHDHSSDGRPAYGVHSTVNVHVGSNTGSGGHVVVPANGGYHNNAGSYAPGNNGNTQYHGNNSAGSYAPNNGGTAVHPGGAPPVYNGGNHVVVPPNTNDHANPPRPNTVVPSQNGGYHGNPGGNTTHGNGSNGGRTAPPPARPAAAPAPAHPAPAKPAPSNTHEHDHTK